MNDSNNAGSSKKGPADLKLIMVVAAVAFIAAFAICIVGSADDSDAEVQTWNLGSPTETDVVASYDTETKILTISGTGAMNGWNHLGDAPWYSFHADITTVVVEDGVTNIGVGAFTDCTSFASFTVPDSIVSIGTDAFHSCSALKNVTVTSKTVPTLGGSVFDDCSADLAILVPSDSVSAYKAATNWSSYSAKIFANIATCTVTEIGDQTYIGDKITPTVVVKDGDKTLTLDEDYSVEYGDNIGPGGGTVTITGIGDYRGTIDKTFNIVKIEAKITVTKTSSCPSGSYNVGASVNSFATLTYKLETGSDIISVDTTNGNITAKAVGKATLKISAAETDTYAAADITVTIEVYDHIHVIVPGTAPTKTTTGLTEGDICSECKKVFVKQESIPATGSEKSVIESKDTDMKYAVPKSDDIKTLNVKLSESKYIIDLNEESTTKVKDTVIEFSITPVENKDNTFSTVMKSNGKEFTGLMNITLPYDPSKGTPTVKWVEGNEKMPIVSTNESDKTIVFSTTHNSTYAIEYSSNAVSGIIIGITLIASILFLGLAVCVIYPGKSKL